MSDTSSSRPLFQAWNGDTGERLLNVGGQLNLNNRVLFTITDDGQMTLGEGVTPDEAAREFVELVNERARAAMEIVQAVAGLEARQSEVWNEVGLYHDSVNVLYIREKARALLGTNDEDD